jgi:hypothetical protein
MAVLEAQELAQPLQAHEFSMLVEVVAVLM